MVFPSGIVVPLPLSVYWIGVSFGVTGGLFGDKSLLLAITSFLAHYFILSISTRLVTHQMAFLFEVSSIGLKKGCAGVLDNESK